MTMNQDDFRAMLQTRKLSEAQIEASIALAEHYQTFRTEAPTRSTTENVWAFSKLLIDQGQNTEENYIALMRYGLFTEDDELYIAALELLDGAEVQANLYHKVGEVFSQKVRDEVFAGIGLSPLGLPSSEKPGFIHPIVIRLEKRVGRQEMKKLLSGCLRDLPNRYYARERRRYRTSKDVDHYLEKRRRAFLRTLKKCQREGRLFYTQEVTDEVIEFVKDNPEIGSGQREGNVVFISKIPYMVKQYLAETDPTMKRYYYCHCPWAREAIKSGEFHFASTFCNCSGGYHKKPWEAIFKRPLTVEVLESILQGDERCRFVVHLPAEEMPEYGT